MKSNSEEEGGDNDAGGSGEGGSAFEFEISSFDVAIDGSEGAKGSPDILNITSFEVEISVTGLEEGESELSASVVTSIGSPCAESILSDFKGDILISGGISRDVDFRNAGRDQVDIFSARPGNLNSPLAGGESDTINLVVGDIFSCLPVNSNTPTVVVCVVSDFAEVFKSDTVGVEVSKIGAKETNTGSDFVVFCG
jgi:hypothetical protein